MVSIGDKVGCYQLVKKLGEGATSSVWKAMNENTHQIVALKIIPKIRKNDKLFEVERSVLQVLNHPNIVKIFDSFEEDLYDVIVEEYIEGESLFDFVNNSSSLTETLCRSLFKQLISAVSYLCKQNYLHRDLKAENLIVTKKSYYCTNMMNEEYIIKNKYHLTIIDFGFAVHLSDKNITPSGSPAYVAPEVISGFKLNSKVGVWSSAVILYAMAAGHLPFWHDDSSILFNKILASYPIYPSTMSDDLIDLLKKMFVKNPNRRITADEVLEHKWLKNCKGSKENEDSNIEIFKTEKTKNNLENNK